MIVRIVKLVIEPERLNGFLEEFEQHKLEISSFEGCQGMKLLQDEENPNLLMTYSHWEHQKALDAYRSSELFTEVWGKVKPLFKERPEAWSHHIVFNGFNE